VKKIILAGLLKDKNLGDRVIADCTKYLYNQVIMEKIPVEYCWVELKGSLQSKRKGTNLVVVLRRLIKKLNWNGLFDRISYKIEKQTKYFESIIKGGDLIVVVGGGLIKYRYQQFWLYISGLIYAAERQRIPVILNAVGIEGYNPHNRRCQVLRKALNSPIVMAITTRDDLNTLREKYLLRNTKIISKLVADPAVFSGTVYQIKKSSNSDLIGIGLIRGGIFKDNGIPLSRNAIINLYVNIILELETRNIPWVFFTNGLPADVELVEIIYKKIGRPFNFKEILVPKSAYELVENISKFKAIIAARLHACIIAYSLGIPAIGLVWNGKLLEFGKNIGYSHRFISCNNFHSKHIVDILEDAIDKGYDLEQQKIYKMTIQSSILDILQRVKIMS